MRRSVFCVCPPGNTQDSARVWRAIIFGCIPVTFFRCELAHCQLQCRFLCQHCHLGARGRCEDLKEAVVALEPGLDASPVQRHMACPCNTTWACMCAEHAPRP